MVLDQLLDSFPIITGQAVTEEWDGDAGQIFTGLDERPFGIELTEIRGVDDPWDYIAEAYRLASQKSDSYARRGIFRFPIALVMHSSRCYSTFATL